MKRRVKATLQEVLDHLYSEGISDITVVNKHNLPQDINTINCDETLIDGFDVLIDKKTLKCKVKLHKIIRR